MSLYRELKRRNVFRVAIAYLALAWLVTEVSGTLFPAFGIPDWGVRFVVIVFALGFVPALIISWVYELTPEGLKREKDVVREESITHLTAKRLDGFTIGLIVVALVFILADRFWLSPRHAEQMAAPAEVVTDTMQTSEPELTESQYPPNSIAVLPFVNMSDDASNEYFSDGISEEILNALARVKDLNVTGRTSSFAFKGQNQDLREIGAALSVAHILEGSVRKAENRIRITAQLIKVDDGYHLWSNIYDRELTDIFAVQDEISGQIVQELKVALGADEQQPLANAQKLTENLQAYELYLRGRHLWQRRGEDNIRRAIDLLEQATTLDPQFARAWSSLAAAHLTLPAYSEASVDEHGPQGVSAARKALALDDTLAEAYAVFGDWAFVNRKWAEAEAHWLRAIVSEPKNSTAHLWYGGHLQAVGRVRDALEETLMAYQLDPLHPGINGNLGWLYWVLDDTSNALKYGAAAWDLGHPRGLRVQALANLRLGEFDRSIGFAEQYDEQSTDRFNSQVMILKLFIEAKVDAAKRPLVLATFAEHETQVPFWFRLLGYVGFAQIDDAYRVANMAQPWFGGDARFLWGSDMAMFRQDPRFAELATELGLVDYWHEHGWPDACQPAGDSMICE